VGGSFALIAGFVGLVGLGVMISNLKTEPFNLVGGVIFGLMLANGLYAVYLRVTGREFKKKKRGPIGR